MLFEVAISNLACECILTRRSVPFHFWVTVTLTSYLVYGINYSLVHILYII